MPDQYALETDEQTNEQKTNADLEFLEKKTWNTSAGKFCVLAYYRDIYKHFLVTLRAIFDAVELQGTVAQIVSSFSPVWSLSDQLVVN